MKYILIFLMVYALAGIAQLILFSFADWNYDPNAEIGKKAKEMSDKFWADKLNK